MTIISRSALGMTALQAPTVTPQAPSVTPLANLGEVCLTDPSRLDLCVYRGDSGRFRVTVTTSTGVPMNITTATWDCDIRKTVDDPDTAGSMTVTPVVGITNAVDVVLSSVTSAALDDPPYVWDLQMTFGAADVTTILKGDLTVEADVSRTP